MSWLILLSNIGLPDSYEPVHEILVFINYAPLHSYADVSSGDIGLYFHPRLHLHPYFIYASSTSHVLVNLQ